MAEFINEIDSDDLEDYNELLMARTQLEMKLMSFQKYVEDKYLAGLDVDGEDIYVDFVTGLIYAWVD